MQKIFMRSNALHRGYIAIILCAFVPLVVMSTKLCLLKSDTEATAIRKKFKFIECYVSEEGISNKAVHINDGSGNVSIGDLECSASEPDRNGKVTITTHSKAYIALKVKAISGAGKITFQNICKNYPDNTIISDFLGTNDITSTRTLTFTMPICHRITFDKLSFTTSNAKIEEATVTGQTFKFDGSYSANGATMDGNCDVSGHSDFFLNPGESYCYWDDWANLKNAQAYVLAVDPPNFSINGVDVPAGNKLPIADPTNRKIMTLKVNGSSRLYMNEMDVLNGNTLTIGKGITIFYNNVSDPCNSNGTISFYGGTGYCGVSCVLTLVVSPGNLGYMHYKDQDAMDRTITISDGESGQTVAITPSTHKYEKQPDGTYKIELELINCEIVGQPQCPQVFVGQ